jgi:hypothetical protein
MASKEKKCWTGHNVQNTFYAKILAYTPLLGFKVVLQFYNWIKIVTTQQNIFFYIFPKKKDVMRIK